MTTKSNPKVDNKVKVSQAIYEISHFACDCSIINIQDCLTAYFEGIDDSKRTLLNETVRSSIQQAFDKSIDNVAKRIDDLYNSPKTKSKK